MSKIYTKLERTQQKFEFYGISHTHFF